MKAAALIGLAVLCAAVAGPAEAGGPWAGVYAGLNGGGGFGVVSDRSLGKLGYFSKTSLTALKGKTPTRYPTALAGGGEIGVNRQYDSLVYGLEADYDVLDLSSAAATTAAYPAAKGSTFQISQQASTRWMVTARPRIGWASNYWLTYATAGVALTDLANSGRFTDTHDAARETGGFASATKFGPVAGVGVERAVSQHLVVRIEYLFADFGRQDAPGVVALGAHRSDITHRTDLLVNTLRLGALWKF